MKDDSLQHQHQAITQFHVKGMEKVIATVSGYHGAERFNLIKLISSSGASYVGNMNQAITHLVCWKFEGRKYELAKKFKIAIVNHRWIEECIMKGRRVSEELYTFQSGEQVGPVCLDTLLGINQAKAQPRALKNSKTPVIDIESDDMDDGAWMDTTLLDELGQNSRRSNRSIRKATQRNSRKNCSSSSRICPETPSGPQIVELEEASTSLPGYSRRLKKRNSTSPAPQGMGRRLVKKHINMEDWLLTSNVEEGCKEVTMLPEKYSSAVLSDISNVGRRQPASSNHTYDMRCSLSGQDNNVNDDEIEEIQDLNDENHACAHGEPSSHPATSEDLCDTSREDTVDVDRGNRQPASSELSCVICWTDFSSTRGVLPCGHRFCFPCIQSWADHMTSGRKPSTCPLCKASFVCITKVDDAVSSDQKIYSQSMPHESSKTDLYILPDEIYVPPRNPSGQVCCRCSSREPEDLLIKCHFCQLRCVHSYCLDPPLFPWTCVHCKDLQLLYLHSR